VEAVREEEVKLWGVGFVKEAGIKKFLDLFHTIQYDTVHLRYIYVRSKTDKMVSLLQRTTQKQKNKEKLKLKTQ